MRVQGRGRRASLRVLLVGASELMRSALRVALATEDIAVVATCDLDADCLAPVRAGQVDVALLVLEPEMLPAGFAVADRLRAHAPGIGLVLLADHADPRLFEPPLPEPPAGATRLDAGVTHEVGQLATALRLARYADQPQPVVDAGRVALTDTQAEVLRLLASGHSNQAIAERRGVSVKAVERSIKRIADELQIPSGGGRNSRVLLTQAHAALVQHGRVPVGG